MRFLLLFLISGFAYADFDISYEVLNCNLGEDSCEVRVEFADYQSDFLYTNSCYDIIPNSRNIQYCIEDLEVRAYRVYNNR